MDPLSIAASVIPVIATAITTVKALNETVGRYKGRDKTLARLQDGLNDLIHILSSLDGVADSNIPILTLLKGPVGRCAQVSHEFDDAMQRFGGKAKIGLKDWAKMEFMKGDINQFIDTLADYKATIAIGLGTITMHTSRLTQRALEEYNEMVKNTAYSLEVRLHRIDEKIASLAPDRSTLLENPSIDLQDEKAVTVQCLRICERASSYIQSLQDGQPTLQKDASQQNAEFISNQFEAQVLTQKTLNENRDKLLETIGRLRERLDSANSNGGPGRDSETLRLQEEIEFSKQCLEVCREAATQASGQKIHIIGEVVAADDCDQVVVTTLADLFNVATVKARNRSIQLVGSMPPDTLLDVVKGRYGSRFGALGTSLATAQLNAAAGLPFVLETQMADSSATNLNQVREDGKSARPEKSYDRPSSNEVRKRRAEGEDGPKKTG